MKPRAVRQSLFLWTEFTKTRALQLQHTISMGCKQLFTWYVRICCKVVSYVEDCWWRDLSHTISLWWHWWKMSSLTTAARHCSFSIASSMLPLHWSSASHSTCSFSKGNISFGTTICSNTKGNVNSTLRSMGQTIPGLGTGLGVGLDGFFFLLPIILFFYSWKSYLLFFSFYLLFFLLYLLFSFELQLESTTHGISNNY